jgi:hypothetical protein
VLGADGLSYFLQSALGTVMDLRVQAVDGFFNP